MSARKSREFAGRTFKGRNFAGWKSQYLATAEQSAPVCDRLVVWRGLRAVLLGLCCVLAVTVSNAARAQGFRNAYGTTIGRFIEPPRAIAQRIESAREAIESESYADAVVVLGDLLARDTIAEQDADLAGQDFFLDAEVPTGQVTRSLLREAEQLLADLPAAGREVYELRYGAQAKRMLDEATGAVDRGQLREVVRRYVNTAAGRQAVWLLASLEMSEGRPIAAVGLLRRLAGQPQARAEFGDALLVRLAEAEHLAGREAAALEHVRGANQGDWAVRLAGEAVSRPAEGTEAAWLESQFGRLDASLRAGVDALRVPSGGVSSRGPGGGDLPLSVLRWEVPTSTSQKQQRLLEVFEASRGDELLPPSWSPIRVGEHLLMRTTERMMAIEFETGLRIWEFPWASGPEASRAEVPAWAMPQEMAEVQDLLVQRVWNDQPYGKLSSDGERVYLLDDLDKLEPVAFNRFRGGFRPADPTSNTLVALELESQGKLVWRRGKSAGELDGTGLGDAFFLGPPLPVEGRLYQLAELAGDTYLLCLEPETGEELWRQQLLANEGAAIESSPLRRVGGAMPAYSDGVLVCPTAGGALVAIDLASRAFLWGTYLPGKDANDSMYDARGRRMPEPTGALLDRWYSGTPVIAEGRVLVTPVEMQALYCFDLLTGEAVWPSILRGDYQYLAGVRDGTFLLASSQEVQAFSLASGNPEWEKPVRLEGGQRVTGTGVFGDGYYLLPVSGQQIWKIDLKSGEVLDKRSTAYPTGNLLAIGDSLVVQGPTSLWVAYAEGPLRERVETLLEEEQQTPWAMLRKGELLLQDGKREEAIAWLKRVRTAAPEDEEVRVRLVDAMLGAIREGQVPDAATTELLDSLIELNPQRIELLRLKVATALEQQKPVEAVGHLRELSRIVLTEEQRSSALNETMAASGKKSKALLDAWIAARLRMALESSSVDQRQAIDQGLVAYAEPLRGASVSVQKRLVLQFGASPASDEARGALVRIALDDGRWLEAERYVLEGLGHAQTAGDVTRADRWLLQLAEVYDRGGFTADALVALETVSDRGASEADVSGVDLGGLAEIRARLQASLQPHQWPRGVEVSAEDGRSTRGRDERWLIDVVGREGLETRGWLPISDKMGIVTLRDERGVEYPIRFDSGPWKNDMIQATMNGGLMILLMPDEIIAVDLLSFRTRPIDAVLWRRPWREQVGGNVASRSVQNFFKHNSRTYRIAKQRGGETVSSAMRLGPIVGRHFYLLQDSELVAIDVTSNQEIWRSGDHPGDAYVVADAQRVAVVSPENGVEILRAEDGALVETRAWEPGERIYAAAGPHVLTRETQPSPDGNDGLTRVVRLRDPLTGEVVLKTEVAGGNRTSSEGACARIIDGRYLVLLTNEARLEIWDLLEGKPLADQALDYDGELSNIEVVPWGDRVVVAVVEPRNEGTGGDAIGSYGDGSEHAEIRGPLYCVSLRDGEVLWSRQLEGFWGMTLHQAPASPLLMLSRSFRYFLDANRPDRTLDVMAIDMRTGNTSVRIDSMATEANVNGLKTDTLVEAQVNAVEVGVDRFGFRFQFVDLPPGQEEAEPVVLDTEAMRELFEASAARRAREEVSPAIRAPALDGF